MNQFILASHDKLAEGFYRSIQFFNSSVNNVHFINAYSDDGKNFKDSFLSQVNDLKEDNLIVFTDLPGGSVNRIVCEHMEEFEYKVVSGINLPLLLELALKPSDVTEQDIREALDESRNQMVYMNDMFKFLKEDDFDD